MSADDVAMRVPTAADVDPRLLAGTGRIELTGVIADHDTRPGLRCPRCEWPVGGAQRVCPSRALARAIRDHRPVPAWLMHLVDQVPGARAPLDPADARAVEDALPGLFDPPTRQAHDSSGRDAR